MAYNELSRLGLCLISKSTMFQTKRSLWFISRPVETATAGMLLYWITVGSRKCTEWWFLWEDKQPDACTNKLYCVWLNLKHPTHHIHLCNALWLSYESISHGALNIPVEENLWYACYTFFFFVGLTGFDSISSCLGLLRDHRPLSTSKQISLIGQYDFKGWLFYLLLVVRISIFSCLTVKSMHIAPGNLSLPLPPPPPPPGGKKKRKGV